MSDAAEGRPYHHGNLRTALLAAAERGLREHGADGLSLRDLARELRVSHAAPRRHFPDRQALLYALAEGGFRQLDGALRSALPAAGEDFPAKVAAVAAAYTRFATENAALLELMYASKHRPGAEAVVKAADGPFGLMHELITEGQEQHVLRAGPPERIGVVLFATLQGIASLINGDMLPPDLRDGLTQQAVEQFLRGAAPTD